jgi:hypothetical protein
MSRAGAGNPAPALSFRNGESMTRLKQLGVAMVALLAMSAVVASAVRASATSDKFTTPTYPIFLHAESAAGVEELVTEAGTFKCAVTFTDTVSEATQQIRLAPTYSNCQAFGFIEVQTTMEGCSYAFNLTTAATHEGTAGYEAHMDVVCPAGKEITIHASTCTAKVPPQKGLKTVDFHEMGTAAPPDLTMRPTVKGIEYTVTKDGFLCPFNGTGTKTGAEYKSNGWTTIRGYADAGGIKGVQVGIDIG